MLVNLDKSFIKNKVVGVAVSGGSDSMALLEYLYSIKDLYSFSIIAINVEHGIRGESSVNDTEFVKAYCKNRGIDCLCYSVDAIKHAEKNKLSLEQSARALRYDCFFNALDNKKCDVVATAHHQKDNFESVLFNLFRGTGLKGLTGISEYEDKIIRPFISVSKTEISEYINKNNIPFVTDNTNFDQSYTRNYIRNSIIPVIESRFPMAEKNVYNFSKIAKVEDEFLDSTAKSYIKCENGTIKILDTIPKALIFRATILALKELGVKKDWESAHLNRAYELFSKQVGKTEDLLLGVIATKEYNGISLSKKNDACFSETPFSLATIKVLDKTIKIEKVESVKDLKSGLYGDFDKIPNGATIRLKKDGDVFKSCNGKTKNFADFLQSKKVPLRERETLPVLAIDNEILVAFGVEISDKIKITQSTKNIIKFTKEN